MILACKSEFKISADSPDTLEGYAAVFDNVDSGGDMIIKGAFARTIKERVKNGAVKFLLDHNWWEVAAIAGTVTEAVEDDFGLFIKIALSKAQSVRDAVTKIVEGHLTDFSIGYNVIRESFPEKSENGHSRTLEEVSLHEVSSVVFGMNELAKVTGFKSLQRFSNMPKARDDHPWDEVKANARLREWVEVKDVSHRMPSYRRAFLLLDPTGLNSYDGHKYQIADIVGGKLTVIPQALRMAQHEIKAMLEHIDKYSQPEESDETVIPLTEALGITDEDLEILQLKCKINLGN